MLNRCYDHSFQTRPGSRPEFRVLIGSPGQFLKKKKSKRHRFNKKTKVNELQPGF